MAPRGATKDIESNDYDKNQVDNLSLKVEPMSGGFLLGRHEVFLPLLLPLPVKALMRLRERANGRDWCDNSSSALRLQYVNHANTAN